MVNGGSILTNSSFIHESLKQIWKQWPTWETTQYDRNVILTIIGHKKKRMKFPVTIMVSWETNSYT